MQNELNVALIEADLIWENPDKNREQLKNKIDLLESKIDLIILPEMFTSGFTMQPSIVAESMTGSTVQWMRNIAESKNAAVCGSVVIKEKGTYYNRLLFVCPEGDITTYDKKHSFTLAGEHKAYTSGTKKVIIPYKGWKICPLICYDLRFPVWARNTESYDLLLYVANWPEPRINAWDVLLQARAIENMSYCIGVNRTGIDGNGHTYPGHSAVYDGLGVSIERTTQDGQAILANLNLNELHNLRRKLNFLNDRDSFTFLD